MKVIFTVQRKEGLSYAAFKEYYENHHAPLITRLLPYFCDYTRNYIGEDEKGAPAHLDGTAMEPGFDVITEIAFSHREDYEKMLTSISDPVIGNQIAEDEDKFVRRGSIAMYIVDERKTPADQLRPR
ncbi:EthD domain-containing protein [Sphingomonas sp. SRS2]|uniref:EthD domain-containing protein n=1 Tax=Sphingomonas sp. SRS2 TaxID=133190 RepID=UPI0006184CC6|nr:EthD domain-containing protein [Sphingomonas sp. SRS2]KKC25194.1 hypothetical protein WP12_15025 [Sphingomonas sp. SRS2]